jgi:hypothetical protein
MKSILLLCTAKVTKTPRHSKIHLFLEMSGYSCKRRKVVIKREEPCFRRAQVKGSGFPLPPFSVWERCLRRCGPNGPDISSALEKRRRAEEQDSLPCSRRWGPISAGSTLIPLAQDALHREAEHTLKTRMGAHIEGTQAGGNRCPQPFLPSRLVFVLLGRRAWTKNQTLEVLSGGDIHVPTAVQPLIQA